MMKSHSQRNEATFPFEEDTALNNADGPAGELRSPLLGRRGATVFTRSNKVSTQAVYDLSAYMLPPNLVFPKPTSLADHPVLLAVVLKVVDNNAINNGDSKSFPRRTGTLINLCVKVIEAAWIRGYFRVEDWTESLTNQLLEEMKHGGWLTLLKVEQRLNNWATSIGYEKSLSAIQPSLISSSLRAFPSGSISHDGSTFCVREKRPGQSVILDFQGAVNLLAAAAGLQVQPYINHAGRRGSQGRGQTISADELAEHMAKSLDFVEAVGKPLIAVFKELVSWRAGFSLRDSVPPNFEQWANALEIVSARGALEDVLGERVRLFVEKKTSCVTLYSVVDAFQASAFDMLLFMNARRKDEVAHRDIGLFASSFRTIDSQLSIHEVDFYIEKTVQDRVKFFVNEATINILGLLRDLSATCVDMAKVHKFSSENNASAPLCIFNVPDIRQMNQIRIFDPYAEVGISGQFLLEKAPACTRPFESRAYRRAYALLYYYRYVNSTLSALSQQLVHFDHSRTHTYISAHPDTGVSVKALYGLDGVPFDQRLAGEHVKLQKELNNVAFERTEALVLKVLNGDGDVLGGFHKLVRRFAAVLLGHISFDSLEKERSARAIARSLERRGLKPYPMPHADCWRGTSQTNLKGRCQGPGDVGPRRERASPEACNGCPFEGVYRQHTLNLEKECLELEERLDLMPSGTLLHRKAKQELFAGRRIIQLRLMRMK